MSKGKKLSKGKKIVLTSLLVLVLLAASGIGYIYYKFSSVTQAISKTDKDLGITEEAKSAVPQDKIDDLINIALFGVDSRDPGDDVASRSDSIIVLTLDNKNHEVRVASVMRDTYVAIDGRGNDKITHAYAFGGPQLAVKTLNQNFALNIKDYVTVDFFGLEKIIDKVGGVAIDVKQEELASLNGTMQEAAKIENKTVIPVQSAGLQTLNGMQAVAYSRIRHVGNGDYERTERQRRVIQALFTKLKSVRSEDYLSLINSSSSFVKTSLTVPNMVKLANNYLANSNADFKEARFPRDNESEGKLINKIYYLVADMDKTKTAMHSFIYEGK